MSNDPTAKLILGETAKVPLQFDEPQTRRRLTQEDIEKGLGAELVGTLPTGDNPMVAFALRDELLRWLRSSGGLQGVDKRPIEDILNDIDDGVNGA
ncbi:MAG: hypothetical protein FD176_182 [Rhodospirillaceae bacterium]|nr:MAG: hypothetical protein FD176_182 [Rhodospirillaceae bacterium]TNC98700.1 MAG: hypothetical protein FD119_171 [Stygiobacter sp.]